MKLGKFAAEPIFPDCRFGKDAYGLYAEVSDFDLVLSRYEHTDMTEESFLIALRKISLRKISFERHDSRIQEVDL